jgi:hypothetical protein
MAARLPAREDAVTRSQRIQAALRQAEQALENLRNEIANTNHSGERSPIGIGTRGQGDPKWHENDRSEFMDRTTEEADERSDGASSSAELTASRMLSVSRQRSKLKKLPTLHGGKAKAGR